MNRIFLGPLAAAFKLGVALRYAAYRRGWFKAQRLNRPVVSVGNLTVGGTGKTPLVMFIAERLLNRGWKPVILTRGYGRRGGADIISLAPALPRVADAREVGDEAALLARLLPEIPIVVCTDRYRAGRLAEERYGVDVHLLDDGFQYLALARDVDVVVVDVTQEFSDEALLPAGRLREPWSALARAHLIVLTRVELADPLPLEDRVRRINRRAKIFRSSTTLRGLVDAASGAPYPAELLQAKTVAAFCGVGNPQAFFGDLKRWGSSVAAEVAFPDHHVYNLPDLRRLAERALELGATALVTTEKDVMNFPAARKCEIPVLACAIRAEIFEADVFEEALLSALEVARVRA